MILAAGPKELNCKSEEETGGKKGVVGCGWTFRFLVEERKNVTGPVLVMYLGNQVTGDSVEPAYFEECITCMRTRIPRD